jgi:hypothetical protein
MNKSIYILAIGLVLSAFAFTACEKGSTIGSIGRENPYPIVEFDTFVPPSAVYYFWGVFDGHFRTWEEGFRSEIPGERIEINFYQCANFVDTPSVNFVYDSLDLVRLGAWPFSNLERGEWGAEIVYIDKNRDRWSTQSGSGNTTDSYFRLTDLYPRSNPDTTDTFARFVIEGEFAGRIYNGGNEIAITNSKFRAKLVARKPVGFE